MTKLLRITYDEKDEFTKDFIQSEIDYLTNGGVQVQEVQAMDIINNTFTPELVEENFPKGKCKERGHALVLHAKMLIYLAQNLIKPKE